MGLQEGRREHLLPEELSDKEKERLEERHLERYITLDQSYQKARRALLILTLLIAGDILLLPRAYKLSFPVSAQAAQLLMAYGYQGHMVVGFAAALLVAGVYALLWWLSRRHYGWMIVAAGLYFLDTAGSFFMLNMMNYEHTMVRQSAGVDVAAGIPGLGAAMSDYVTAFMIAVFVHLALTGCFIYGAVMGAKLRRVPQVSIREKTVEKPVYHEEVDYTEHPEEGTVPRRPVEKGAVTLIRANVQGMRVEVCRAYGVTALAVDGQVYNDQKGAVEPAYRLRACVNGVHFLAEHTLAQGHSVMTLYADSKEVGRKKRRL